MSADATRVGEGVPARDVYPSHLVLRLSPSSVWERRPRRERPCCGVNDRLSLFLFGFWEHNGYREDVPRGEGFESMGRPELDIFEPGGGLTHAFSSGWSLRPELRYIKDDGNTLCSDYSATEIWMSVRKSF